MLCFVLFCFVLFCFVCLVLFLFLLFSLYARQLWGSPNAGSQFELVRHFLARDPGCVHSRGADGLGFSDLCALGGSEDHLRCIAAAGGGGCRSTSGDPVRSRTTVHLAVLGGHTDTLAFLSATSRRVHVADATGRTPFALACALGLEDAVEVFTREGSSEGRTVVQGRAHVVAGRWVLGPGCGAVVTTPAGETPLMLASAGPHPGVVRALLAVGAPVGTCRGNGDTALHIAVLAATRARAARSEAGTLSTDVTAAQLRVVTPLVEDAAVSVVRLLLDMCAPQIPNRRGWYPLHIAAAIGSVKLVTALASCGDVNVVTLEGHNVLRVAEVTGQTEVAALVRVLLAKPRSPDLRCFSKFSARFVRQSAPRSAPVACVDEIADDDGYRYDVEHSESSSEAPSSCGASEAADAADADADAAFVCTWACSVCTLLNTPFTSRCDACGSQGARVLKHAMDRLARAVSASRTRSSRRGTGGAAPPRARLVVSEAAVYEEFSAAAAACADVLRVPLRAAGFLLRRAKWDRDALATRLLTDRAAVLAEAGIFDEARDAGVRGGGGAGPVEDEARDAGVRGGGGAGPVEDVSCAACFNDVRGADAAAMSCGGWRRARSPGDGRAHMRNRVQGTPFV